LDFIYKKKSIHGTSLTKFNSFAVLDNSDISDLVGGLGINVSEYQFEIFDLMKDIEVARHALDNVKKIRNPDPNELLEEPNMISDEIHLLQWLDDDSEVEQFTLV
jgi:hypothetical protein